MDEPTNHLDIASRDVLEDALVAYPGTVVLITHDRHLIRSVADRIIDVRDGTATLYPGDFEYFAAKTGLDVTGAALDGSAAAVPATARERAPAREDDRKRVEAERRNRVYRATKDLRGRVDAVERELGEVEAEIAELNRALADPSVYEDGARVTELVARHNAAKDRSAALTEEWEALLLELEDATERAERGSV